MGFPPTASEYALSLLLKSGAARLFTSPSQFLGVFAIPLQSRKVLPPQTGQVIRSIGSGARWPPACKYWRTASIASQ